MSKPYLQKYSKCLSHTCGWTLKTHLGWWVQAVSVRQTSTMQSFIEGPPAPPPCICCGPTSISFRWNWVRSGHASLTCCSDRDLAFLDLAKWLLPQGPCIAFSLLGKFFLQVSFQLTLSLASTVSGVLCDQIKPIYFCLSVVSVAKSCLTLWDLHGCSPPVSPVHGILQASLLEWIAISFSRGSSRPRDGTHVSCTGRWVLYCWASRKEPTPIKK